MRIDCMKQVRRRTNAALSGPRDALISELLGPGTDPIDMAGDEGDMIMVVGATMVEMGAALMSARLAYLAGFKPRTDLEPIVDVEVTKLIARLTAAWQAAGQNGLN